MAEFDVVDLTIDSTRGILTQGGTILGTSRFHPHEQGKLQDVLDLFATFDDPADRTNLLLSYADQFREVPRAVATRPFAKEHLVPHCESEAYVWALRQPDGTLKLHFAVENPSGVSAKALATILDKTLSGLPAAEIAT